MTKEEKKVIKITSAISIELKSHLKTSQFLFLLLKEDRLFFSIKFLAFFVYRKNFQKSHLPL
jgi:hypothetical protein